MTAVWQNARFYNGLPILPRGLVGIVTGAPRLCCNNYKTQDRTLMYTYMLRIHIRMSE